jgi:hypothetical protein
VVNLTVRLLYPHLTHWEKSPQYSLNRRLEGPQNRFGLFGAEINLLSISRFKSWLVWPVA